MEDLVTFDGAFAGRRVFVTGHTGFKGSWLTAWLLDLGADVTGYALPPDTDPNLFDALGLAEDHVQPDNGRIGQPAAIFDGGNDVSQHVSGADAGQLVYVANQQQVSAGRDGFQQVICQQQIQHGCFVYDHQVCLQRVLLVALKESSFSGFELKQPVDRFGRMPGGL